MQTIRQLPRMIRAFFKWFHATTIAPPSGSDPLPPIRIDGDPRDIYLS